MNTISLWLKNQQVNQQNLKNHFRIQIRSHKKFIETDPIPIQEILDNPGLYFEKLRANKRQHTKLKVFNYIIFMCNKYRTAYFSQRRLAKLLGKSNYWVSQLIKELEALGLIATQYRVFRTKRYKLSLFFYQPTIAWRLSSIFSALKKVWVSITQNFSVVSSIEEIDTKYLKQIESLSTAIDSETLEPKSNENTQKGEGLGMFNNFRAHLKSVYTKKMLAKEIMVAVNEENQPIQKKKEYYTVGGKIFFTDPEKQKQHEAKRTALQQEADFKKQNSNGLPFYNNEMVKYKEVMTDKGLVIVKVV
jgi:DNA-binding Lrp family transcriptional regulator